MVIQDDRVWKERAETFFDSSEYEIKRQLVLGRNTKCDHSNETSALAAVLSCGAIYLVNHAVFGQRFYSVTQPFAYIFNGTVCFPTFEKLKLGYSF